MILFHVFMLLCVAYSLYCLFFVVGGILSAAVLWPFQKAREGLARVFPGHHWADKRIR